MGDVVKIIAAAFLTCIIISNWSQVTLAEVKKPGGSPVVSPVVKGKTSNLSEFDCSTAKGRVVDEFACNSLHACEVTDSKGNTHRVCLSHLGL